MAVLRAATSFADNGVVALAVARWEKELNRRKLGELGFHPEFEP
ncbi:MAG TPA: hypothetical protein VHV26_03515 [Rhizomicrobium sp.]|jgi:hypothetical protein|nr:hypothetical protein [Rhizomicrobium sp.]